MHHGLWGVVGSFCLPVVTLLLKQRILICATSTAGCIYVCYAAALKKHGNIIFKSFFQFSFDLRPGILGYCGISCYSFNESVFLIRDLQSLIPPAQDQTVLLKFWFKCTWCPSILALYVGTKSNWKHWGFWQFLLASYAMNLT